MPGGAVRRFGPLKGVGPDLRSIVRLTRRISLPQVAAGQVGHRGSRATKPRPCEGPARALSR